MTLKVEKLNSQNHSLYCNSSNSTTVILLHAMDNITTLRATLLLVIADVEKLPADDRGPYIETLSVLLCRLVKLLVPNSHQKLDEILLADELHLQVNPHPNGADLLDTEGNALEVKTSVLGKDGRCNFNWGLPRAPKKTPKDQYVTVRRARLLESIRTKTKGRGALLVIKDCHAVTVKRVELSHAFLMHYFALVPLDSYTTTNHNMGCTRCKQCGGFHRLEKLERASKNMDSVKDWAVFVTERVQAQCGGK